MSAADTKPDLSEFLALGNGQPTTCIVAISRAQLNKRDQINLDGALMRKDADGRFVVPDNSISKWLKGRGLGGRADAVKKHRNGDCCCV